MARTSEAGATDVGPARRLTPCLEPRDRRRLGPAGGNNAAEPLPREIVHALVAGSQRRQRCARRDAGAAPLHRWSLASSRSARRTRTGTIVAIAEWRRRSPAARLPSRRRLAVERVVEQLDGLEVAVKAGNEGDRATVVDLEDGPAPVGVADPLQQRQPATHVGAPADRHLEHAELVVDRAPQPFGVDPVGGDQLGRLAGEGVGLVAIGVPSAIASSLRTFATARGRIGAVSACGRSCPPSQRGVTAIRIVADLGRCRLGRVLFRACPRC